MRVVIGNKIINDLTGYHICVILEGIYIMPINRIKYKIEPKLKDLVRMVEYKSKEQSMYNFNKIINGLETGVAFIQHPDEEYENE